jgi:predicted phosphodiesterase
MSDCCSRIGLIGDIHCQVARLEAAIEFLRGQLVDVILTVGDVVDGPGDAARTIDILRAERVTSVLGNHDRWFLRGEMRELADTTPLGQLSTAQRSWLEQRPGQVELPTPLGPLLLCHGLGANDLAKVDPDDDGYAIASNTDLQELIAAGRFALVCNGHSHRAMVRRFGGLFVVNAGTLLPDHGPGIALVDAGALQAQLFDFAAAGPIAAATRAVSLRP